MKKITILSLAVILTLVLGTGVLATSNSFTGKQIQGETPLFLNGNEFSNNAIIVDGVSFVPVREVSEKLGLEVDYRDGEIFLEDNNSNVGSDNDENDNGKSELDSESNLSERVNYLETMIEDMTSIINTTKGKIIELQQDKSLAEERESDPRIIENIEASILTQERSLQIQEKTRSDLESQLEQLLNN